MNSESSIPSSKRWAVVLCLIVLAAVSLRVYLAEGFVPVDEAEFARVAYAMSNGTFDYERYAGPPVIPVRTGTVLPVAALMALFGPGDVQLAAYPLLSSVAVLLLIYLFAAKNCRSIPLQSSASTPPSTSRR